MGLETASFCSSCSEFDDFDLGMGNLGFGENRLDLWVMVEGWMWIRVLWLWVFSGRGGEEKLMDLEMEMGKEEQGMVFGGGIWVNLWLILLKV